MRLRQLYLYPDLVEHQDAAPEVDRIRYETRYLCVAVEQELARRRIETDGFTRLCLVGTAAPGPEPFVVNTSRVAVCDLAFDLGSWRSLREPVERARCYRDLLLAGADRLEEVLPEVSGVLRSSLEQVAAEALEHRWTTGARQLRDVGLEVALAHEVSMTAWRTDLRVTSP